MILLRVHFLLLLACILYVACVEGGRHKEEGRAKEKSKSEGKTGTEEKKDAKNTEQNAEVKRRYWFPKKLLNKGFHVAADKVKDVWNKHVAGYKNPGRKGRKFIVSKKGKNAFIGERELPKRTEGKGSKALCEEVLSKRRHEDLKKIETKIMDENDKDISDDFTLKDVRLWKCLDRILTDTFFVVEREYKGLKEMQTATSFHNVKAWRIQLTSFFEDVSDTSKTVRFIERKFLDEKGEPINYLGEIKYESPDRTKWKFLNKKREEEEGANGKEGEQVDEGKGKDAEKEGRRRRHKDRKEGTK